MSVEGLCEICETETVDDRCERCAKLVCERHFDEDRHICVQCVAEMGEPRRDPAVPEDTPEDVDTYQF